MREFVPRMGTVVNGWLLQPNTMGVYGDFYLKRSCVTLWGLGANQTVDAFYPSSIADAHGQPLSGDDDYVALKRARRRSGGCAYSIISPLCGRRDHPFGAMRQRGPSSILGASQAPAV